MKTLILSPLLLLFATAQSMATISLTGSFIPSAFSANGAIAAGRSGSIATVYENTNGVTLLGTFPEADSQSSNVSGISADGTVVTGYSRSSTDNEAFRWTSATGLQKLKDLTGRGSYTGFTNASGISRNGQEAFIWSVSGGFTALGDVAGGNVTSVARDVTNSGNIILGGGFSSVSTLETLKWDQSRQLTVINTGISQSFLSTMIGEGDTKAILASSGYVVELDLVSGATDILLDSSRFSNFNLSETFADSSLNTFVVAQRYFYLRESDEVFTASDFLESKGISVDPSWSNIRVTGISDDGKTIGGRVSVNGVTNGFIATIPEPSTFAFLLLGAFSLASRRRQI